MEHPSEYPIECPSCRQFDAWPKAVTTVKGQSTQLEIELLCRGCDYRWSDTVGLPDTG